MKKILVFLFTTILCLDILISCNDKKQNNTTKKTIEKAFYNKDEVNYLDSINDPNYLISLLDNSSDLESSAIGIAGEKSQSYSIFERLCAIASDTMLVRLTKHTNPKIRVYGMWALTEKNKQLALAQMKLLKNDKAILVYKSGCTTIQKKVCHLIASRFNSSEVELKPKKNAHSLDFDIVIK